MLPLKDPKANQTKVFVMYLSYLFISFEDSIVAFDKRGDERSFTHDANLVLWPVVVIGYIQEKRNSNSDATNSP